MLLIYSKSKTNWNKNKRSFESHFAGEYNTAFKGKGMAFSEVEIIKMEMMSD